ncbi:MAG: hypothetical protein K8S87_02065 [Planctomycetes bacterium]|nr:hypothetical protein [Planctomycetota bacterium]
MNNGSKKTVIIGVSSGIAAFKVGNLITLLRDDFDCRIVMTENATKLIAPVTFANLTQNPVLTDLWEGSKDGVPVHINLADIAKVLCIAPATANIISKLANGIADDALSTVAIAVDCPTIIAPAMNHRMFNHPIVQGNLKKLRDFGYYILEPEEGWLACGHESKGRLPKVETIAGEIRRAINGEIKPPSSPNA